MEVFRFFSSSFSFHSLSFFYLSLDRLGLVMGCWLCSTILHKNLTHEKWKTNGIVIGLSLSLPNRNGIPYKIQIWFRISCCAMHITRTAKCDSCSNQPRDLLPLTLNASLVKFVVVLLNWFSLLLLMVYFTVFFRSLWCFCTARHDFLSQSVALVFAWRSYCLLKSQCIYYLFWIKLNRKLTQKNGSIRYFITSQPIENSFRKRVEMKFFQIIINLLSTSIWPCPLMTHQTR